MAYEIATMDGFTLGTPALVCRWRLYQGRVPYLGRHLAALRARRLDGGPIPASLVEWVAKQLACEAGAPWPSSPHAEEDAVLTLLVNADGTASLTTTPYQPLERTTLSELASRSVAAQAEAARTGVAPEALWVVETRGLVWDAEPGARASGVAAQMEALARMNGLPVTRRPGLGAQALRGMASLREAFLSSDEHGVVAAEGAEGPRARSMAAAYQRALARARRA